MESAMIQKVNSLLDKYIGGEIFFDELDDAIRTDDEIIKRLLHLSTVIRSSSVWENENNTRIVMSGKTGYAIKEWGWDADILLPGGLRKMTDIPLDFAKQVEAGKIYFFVDDSYFSGRTESVVKEIIERGGGIFGGSIVAYDGCHEVKKNVWSLYRYYNHYDIRGRKLNVSDS